MRTKLTILCMLVGLLSAAPAKAVKVYKSKTEGLAHVKVYETSSEGLADCIIYVTSSEGLASGNAKWYFTSSEGLADVKVYFTSSEGLAPKSLGGTTQVNTGSAGAPPAQACAARSILKAVAK